MLDYDRTYVFKSVMTSRVCGTLTRTLTYSVRTPTALPDFECEYLEEERVVLCDYIDGPLYTVFLKRDILTSGKIRKRKFELF